MLTLEEKLKILDLSINFKKLSPALPPKKFSRDYKTGNNQKQISVK